MATISDFLLRIQVTGADAVDKLKVSVEDVSKTFTKATDAADKFNAKSKATADGATKASDAINGFKNSVLSAASGTTTFGEGIGGLIGKIGPMGMVVGTAVAAIGALFTHAVQTADKIGDLSDATGISAGRLMSFKDSIILAGGSTESFEKMAAKLNVTIGEAVTGNEKVRKSFRELGVDLGDANGKIRSTDDLLPEIIAKLGEIPDTSERAARAVELLGKSAAKIEWSKVKADSDIFTDQRIAQLSKYQDAIDELANSIEHKLITAFGKLAIAVKNEGAVLGSTGWIDSYIDQFQYWINEMIYGKKVADDVYQTMQKFRSMTGTGKELKPGQQALPPGVEASTAGAGRGNINPPKISQTGQLAITEEGQKTIDQAVAVTNLLKEQDKIAGEYAMKLNDTIGLRQTEGDIVKAQLQIEQARDSKLADINAQIEKELADKTRDQRITAALVEQLREQGKEVTRQAEVMKTAKADELTKLQQQKDLIADILLLNQQIAQTEQVNQSRNKNELIKYYGDELKMQEGIMAINNEKANAITASENKLRALGKNATQEDMNRSNQEIQFAKSVADQKLEILKDQLDKEKALRNNASEGAKRALYDIEQSMTPFKKSQDAINNMWSTMGSAIDNFVTTGKFSFNDLARSMIQDIIKIELKAQASQIFSGIFGSGGLLSGVFGSIMGKATGGSVASNTPYIVGEQGPELFVPNGGGTIIPNNQMSSAMNGGNGSSNVTHNTYITNNISAIDSRSVAQMFAENRKSLLGTVQLAQKEMPYSNR